MSLTGGGGGGGGGLHPCPPWLPYATRISEGSLPAGAQILGDGDGEI